MKQHQNAAATDAGDRVVTDMILRRFAMRELDEDPEMSDLCSQLHRCERLGDFVEQRRALIELAAAALNRAQRLPIPR